MRGLFLVAVAAVGVTVAGWRGLRPNAGRVPADRSGPLLVSTERPGADAVTAGEAEDDPGSRATALALASLTPAERDALAAALDDLAARLEARSNPLSDDLEDGPPEAEIESAARYFLPTFTAARSLASGAWSSADGFQVRAVRRCPDGAPCVRLYADGDATPEASRARFLAWPLASAAILRARDGAGAARTAAGVRASIGRGVSQIALVASGAELRAGAVDWADLRDKARAVLRFTRGATGPGTRAIALLAALPPRGGAAPFLALADDEIIVVPRMGSLARPASFFDEVKTRVATFEASERLLWEHRPTALKE